MLGARSACANSSRSKPAQNADPAPVSTTARTAGSVAQPSSCSVISLRSLIDSALRRSGRDRVSVATPSSATCVAMSRLIAPPSSVCEENGIGANLGTRTIADNGAKSTPVWRGYVDQFAARPRAPHRYLRRRDQLPRPRRWLTDRVRAWRGRQWRSVAARRAAPWGRTSLHHPGPAVGLTFDRAETRRRSVPAWHGTDHRGLP